MPSFLPHRINIYQWMKFLTLCRVHRATIYITRKRIYYRPGLCVPEGGTIAPDCAPSSLFDTCRVKRNMRQRICRDTLQTVRPFLLLFLFYPQLFLALFLWISSTNFFSENIARKYARVFPTKINHLRTVFFNTLIGKQKQIVKVKSHERE